MKFSFSAEQEEFRAAVRRYLADRSPTTEVRRLMATEAGWDRATWNAMNAELGLCAVRIPEAHGGHGFGFAEHCIVLEEMGRALCCTPYFASTVLGAGALMHGANADEQAALLPGIASGQTVATLVNQRAFSQGTHSVSFDATGLSSGMYLYRIEAGSYTSTRKMLLLK